MNYDVLSHKKEMLDTYRPLPEALIHNLDDWFRVELTYTSNAIEGNTLTRRETALVVEKGLTVGGKSLVEHLEAANHASALDWVRNQVARMPKQLITADILEIHRIVLHGIDDGDAGHYRSVPVRISGSVVVLPNPRKVPELMGEFFEWLHGAKKMHPVELAAEAHYRLVSIHPFVDGNGRTARLLMNLILLMQGYPAAIIRKRDRLKYITGLEQAQLGGTKDDYMRLMMKSVDRSLDIYLKAARGDDDAVEIDSDALLKIGALAKQVGESNPTIRYWTKLGLLDVADISDSGYHFYSPEMIQRVERIHALKAKRYTLGEIKNALAEP